MTPLLKRLLLRDEGFRRSCYVDSLGYYTIGIGKLIDARKGGGITLEEAMYLLENEIREKTRELGSHLPWLSRLDPVRHAVLVSMAFQLGVAGVLAFRNTLKAAEEGRWNDAADGMLRSKWATQTPGRALRLAEAFRTGDEGALRLDEEPPYPPLPPHF